MNDNMMGINKSTGVDIAKKCMHRNLAIAAFSIVITTFELIVALALFKLTLNADSSIVHNMDAAYRCIVMFYFLIFADIAPSLAGLEDHWLCQKSKSEKFLLNVCIAMCLVTLSVIFFELPIEWLSFVSMIGFISFISFSFDLVSNVIIYTKNLIR